MSSKTNNIPVRFKIAIAEDSATVCMTDPVCPHHLTHLDQTLPAVEGVTEALQQGNATLLLLLAQLAERGRQFMLKVRAVDVEENKAGPGQYLLQLDIEWLNSSRIIDNENNH